MFDPAYEASVQSIIPLSHTGIDDMINQDTNEVNLYNCMKYQIKEGKHLAYTQLKKIWKQLSTIQFDKAFGYYFDEDNFSDFQQAYYKTNKVYFRFYYSYSVTSTCEKFCDKQKAPNGIELTLRGDHLDKSFCNFIYY